VIARAALIDGKGEVVPDKIVRDSARSLAEWMTGRGEGVSSGYLRERQWLRPSAGGELIAMPECYRFDIAL
jgi:hypothetical protein